MHVARAFGCRGAVLSLPAACAAGNYAIAMAADLLRSGRADVAVCGAAEMLQESEFCGFLRLGALAPERPRPFDLHRAGLILGEGAGVFVLETEGHAVRRGATALAEVGGYGVACDGFHITRPLPDARGITRAMREAITRSGLTPAEVDFVNAHGTATKANDAAESLAMAQAFEGRRVPISSIKSMLGHTMGASSALEAASCVETLLTGVYPPTIHYETPDPECDVHVVATRRGRGSRRRGAQQRPGLRRLRRRPLPGEARPPPLARGARRVKPLSITGLGVVSPFGVGWDVSAWGLASADDPFAASTSLFDLAPYDGARVAEVRGFDAAKHLGATGLRNHDRLTKLLVVAARSAIAHAGLKVDGAWRRLDPDAVGVVGATAYGSLEAIHELNVVARTEDPRYLNPARFPNTVINSSVGYVSIWDELRALNATVVNGTPGALDAVASASLYLAAGRAQAVLVGGGGGALRAARLSSTGRARSTAGARRGDPGATGRGACAPARGRPSRCSKTPRARGPRA